METIPLMVIRQRWLCFCCEAFKKKKNLCISEGREPMHHVHTGVHHMALVDAAERSAVVAKPHC